MTDGQLLERFLTQGDENAFEVLMHRHGPMVLGVCRRVLADPHDTEDAFQATFLVLVRKAASLRNGELLGNWLYGAAYRAALEAKAARRRSRERQVNLMPEPAAPTVEPREDLMPLLDRELSCLPEKHRMAVVLCDLEGGTLRDVARQIGIPVGTLSGRLTTARRRLARQLTRRGVTLSVAGLAALLAESTASASIPAPLAISTLKAATAVAGKRALDGLVLAHVAALTKGVLDTMLLAKLKYLTALLLAAAVCGGGALALLTYPVQGTEPKVAGHEAPVRAAVAEDEKAPAYLGLILRDEEDNGFVAVQEVAPDSPAAKAKLKPDDIVVKVGGVPSKSASEVVKGLRNLKVGDKVTLRIKRGDKEMDVTVTAAKRPANFGKT
jgi:RNA polymerase sigma factor (sigma-70 family)